MVLDHETIALEVQRQWVIRIKATRKASGNPALDFLMLSFTIAEDLKRGSNSYSYFVSSCEPSPSMMTQRFLSFSSNG